MKGSDWGWSRAGICTGVLLLSLHGCSVGAVQWLRYHDGLHIWRAEDKLYVAKVCQRAASIAKDAVDELVARQERFMRWDAKTFYSEVEDQFIQATAMYAPVYLSNNVGQHAHTVLEPISNNALDRHLRPIYRYVTTFFDTSRPSSSLWSCAPIFKAYVLISEEVSSPAAAAAHIHITIRPIKLKEGMKGHQETSPPASEATQIPKSQNLEYAESPLLQPSKLVPIVGYSAPKIPQAVANGGN